MGVESATSGAAPEELGRYELLVPLAAGGMARVWAARLRGVAGFSRVVVVKTVLPHLAGRRAFQEMLLTEGRLGALIHHPNLCACLDVGEVDGRAFVVLEWLEGASVQELLDAGGALDLPLAARIAADAAMGLQALHEVMGHSARHDGPSSGIVHGDVSPHNLFVTLAGHTKVLDLGVASAQGEVEDPEGALEGMGRGLRGKVPFLSPEQIAGAPADPRSDVYALGCALYAMTTGQAPFGDVPEHVALARGQQGPPPAPHRLRASYPRDLEAIVLRAMQRDPGARYPSALALAQALTGWLGRRAIPLEPADMTALVARRAGEAVEKRRRRVEEALAFRGDAFRVGPFPRTPVEDALPTDAHLPEFHDDDAPPPAKPLPRSRPWRMALGIAMISLVGAWALGLRGAAKARAPMVRPMATTVVVVEEHGPPAPPAEPVLEGPPPAAPSPAPAPSPPSPPLRAGAAASPAPRPRPSAPPLDLRAVPSARDAVLLPLPGNPY